MFKNIKSKNIKDEVSLKTALEIKALLPYYVIFHKRIYTQYILNSHVSGL